MNEIERSNLSICLFIFFYGNLPTYFNIFLKGAEFNSQINFKIVTDITPPEELPPNVEFVQLTISEFCALAQKKTAATIDENIQPYKFCDFRPGYGLIMQDYIKDFEYWGYCDLDMIMGDLSTFLKPLLGKYDLISSRNTWMHGPLSIYKNSTVVNKLFMQGKDWKLIFESNDYLGFDETGKKMGHFRSVIDKSQNFLSVKTLPLSNRKDIESFTEVVFRFKNELNSYAEEMVVDTIEQNEYVSYNNGSITDFHKKEWPCYHWVMEKKLNQFSYPNWSTVPDQFIINRFGFFDSNSVSTLNYKIQIIKRDLIGKIKDTRDIIWLARNNKWSSYYNKKYLDSNSSLTRILKLVLHLSDNVDEQP
ncbi:DUF6625 family protein [Reichenbachiella sp.]|uniref:DUF6625 family protein n=1 Tax=Reichenbachiella sp. TaxID=2184521 RepID=UPI003BB1C327